MPFTRGRWLVAGRFSARATDMGSSQLVVAVWLLDFGCHVRRFVRHWCGAGNECRRPGGTTRSASPVGFGRAHCVSGWITLPHQMRGADGRLRYDPKLSGG